MAIGDPPKNPVHLSDEKVNLCQHFLSLDICLTIRIHLCILLALGNSKEMLNFGQVAIAHCKNRNYITRISKLYAEEGIEGVLRIKRNPASDVANLKLNARIESQLVAMACTPPRSHYVRWTVELCTEELNRRTGAKYSQSTVWRALLRTHPFAPIFQNTGAYQPLQNSLFCE